MFVTAHDDLAQRARLRNHGASPKYRHKPSAATFASMNCRPPFTREAQAVRGWIDRRITNAAQYRQLKNVPGLILLRKPSAILGINLPYASKIMNAVMPSPRLREAGIGHEIYYPEALHVQPCFATHKPAPAQWPSNSVGKFESADLSRAASQIEGVQPD